MMSARTAVASSFIRLQYLSEWSFSTWATPAWKGTRNSFPALLWSLPSAHGLHYQSNHQGTLSKFRRKPPSLEEGHQIPPKLSHYFSMHLRTLRVFSRDSIRASSGLQAREARYLPRSIPCPPTRFAPSRATVRCPRNVDTSHYDYLCNRASRKAIA